MSNTHQRSSLSKNQRLTAMMLLCIMLVDIMTPTVALALTSGPAQPEYTSFEPVGSSTMVNEFTGDFSYNLPVLEVPGPNGGGYSMSLSYHAGAGPEEEASWVGYGWTLNPGAVNRQVMGIPDDWNGEDATTHNKAPAVKTASVGMDLSTELFSNSLGIGGHAMVRYNNYTGLGYGVGAGITLAQGVVSLGYNISDGGGSFSMQVNPAALLEKRDSKKKSDDADSETSGQAETCEEGSGNTDDTDASGGGQKGSGFGSFLSAVTSNYGIQMMTARTYPMSATKMQGHVFSFSASAMPTVPPAQVGPAVGGMGRFAIQTAEEELTRSGFGTLYHEEADNAEAVMDYHNEDVSPYNKRDKFLAPAFADVDLYQVSGEGIGGVMMLSPEKVRQFRPDAVLSETDFTSVGLEFQLGTSNGPGATISSGQQSLSVGGWDQPNTTAPLQRTDLRMGGDPARSVLYSQNHQPVRAQLAQPDGLPSLQTLDYTAPHFDAVSRGGGSYTIGYNLGSDVRRVEPETDEQNRARRSKAFDPSMELDEPDRPEEQEFPRNGLPQHHVAELSAVAANGDRYTYGLPLYARKEVSLSHSYWDAPGHSDPENNALATATGDLGSCAFKNGTETDEGYAAQYLLTSITDAEYVDLTLDGPTPDDLGGYTKFRYERWYGSDDKNDGSVWYNWRMPYNGYRYDAGAISECYDDRLSYSRGEREVVYLKEIRTRTHVAKFVLNDPINEPREDARGALGEPAAGSSLEQSNSTQALRYLKRIDLYLIGQDGPGAKPIRSVLFDYDYECWPGVPNNQVLPVNQDGGSGKLTLKKVWFEHNGVVEARIAPYEFSYRYPAALTYPAPYENLAVTAGGAEPEYSPYGTNGWGDHTYNGAEQLAAGRTWLHQDPPETFDPAAWQLKRITLPSGGEIHVQYEQDDYLHVQADRAHTMVPLTFYAQGADHVRVDASGLGSQEKIDQWVQLIRNEYVDQEKKMYFRFRFQLRDGASHPRNQENVSGYVRVTNVNAEPGSEVTIHFQTGENRTPRDACRDLFNAEKRGKAFNESCSSEDLFQAPLPMEVNDPEEVVEVIFGLKNVVQGMAGMVITSCDQVVEEDSYLRLPVLQRKLGGGLRVKRLLMYSPQAHLIDEQVALVGSEYIYERYDPVLQDLVSTGVATNEPSTFREENILIRSVDRYAQAWWDRVIAGRDLKASEGPIGESVLPGPSVGYSRVIIRNISEESEDTNAASCPTPIGFSVTEFHTAREHPIIVDPPTDLNDPGAKKRSYTPLYGVYVNRITDKNWLSQGFTIKHNAMHGQLKSQTAYGGLSTLFLGEPGIPPIPLPVAQRTVIEYFPSGAPVPVWTGPRNNTMEMMPLGQEMSIAMEGRSIVDRMEDRAIEGDITWALLFVLVGVGMVNTTMINEVHTHTTTKLIRYPAIPLRTTTFEKGVYHVSQNLGFDRNTGRPLVVRSHDGFLRDLANQGTLNGGPDLTSQEEGIITSHSIPASYFYPAMGQKSKGEGLVLQSSTTGLTLTYSSSTDKIILGASNGSEALLCDALAAMCPGDRLMIRDGSDFYYGHGGGVDGNSVEFLPSGILADGVPNNGPIDALIITRSGCTNTLDTDIGSYTTYGATQEVNVANERMELVDLLNAMLGQQPPQTIQVPPALQPQFVDENGQEVEELLYMLEQGSTLVLKVPNGNDCEKAIFLSGVEAFHLTEDGFLAVQRGPGCALDRFDCPQFSAPYQPTIPIQRVLACDAAIYDDQWTYDMPLYDPDNSLEGYNSYERGERGRWRPLKTFDYRSTTVSNGRNSGSGWFDMNLFNWLLPELNDAAKWVLNSTVQKYSPHGEMLEMRNAIGTTSTTKYGYGHTLPYLSAANCKSSHAHFESFEYFTQDRLEDGLPRWNLGGMLLYGADGAHTGLTCYRTPEPSPTRPLFVSKPIPADQQLAVEGLTVKAWIRAKQGLASVDPQEVVVRKDDGSEHPMNRIARTGDWTLFQCSVPFPQAGPDAILKIHCDMGPGTTVDIDDVALHPTGASFSAQVYNVTNLRLMATLDDRHFAIYQQYDAKGTPMAKRVETERGIVTIGDSHSHTPDRIARP
ncbi:MAG: hypothetical protein JNJ91_03015 [Flavobacteriales bacterium]|nr:hypothetical protein [Flavobacteriales bacterium]